MGECALARKVEEGGDGDVGFKAELQKTFHVMITMVYLTQTTDSKLNICKAGFSALQAIKQTHIMGLDIQGTVIPSAAS